MDVNLFRNEQCCGKVFTFSFNSMEPIVKIVRCPKHAAELEARTIEPGRE